MRKLDGRAPVGRALAPVGRGLVQYDTVCMRIPTTRRGDLVGPPPLNSAFLFRRGGLVGGTTKPPLLVKEEKFSGPSIKLRLPG